MAGIHFSEIKEEFVQKGNYKYKRVSWLDSDGKVIKEKDIRLPVFQIEEQEHFRARNTEDELISFLHTISFIPVVRKNLKMIENGERKVVPALISVVKTLVFLLFKKTILRK